MCYYVHSPSLKNDFTFMTASDSDTRSCASFRRSWAFSFAHFLIPLNGIVCGSSEDISDCGSHVLAGVDNCDSGLRPSERNSMSSTEEIRDTDKLSNGQDNDVEACHMKSTVASLLGQISDYACLFLTSFGSHLPFDASH